MTSFNSSIIDQIDRDFATIFNGGTSTFGTNSGHFSYGKEVDSSRVPQWQKNRSSAMSFGRLTFQHTTPCQCCQSLERWTLRYIPDTKINKCAGCNP